MSTRKRSRNAQGSGTIRQRKDGLWEARYTLPRDPGTGKQVQRSIYGKTQKEVRQKLQQMTMDIDNGVYFEPTQLKVGQWFDMWLAEYIGNVKPFTVASYKTQVNVHIKPKLGATRLSALSTHQIQVFYNELYKGTGEETGLSPKTIKNIHGVLHKALEQAVKLGYIKYNPSDACTLPRWERKEIRPLEGTEVSAFLKAIDGHKYETVYTVTLFTGMRQGEVLGLTWPCVDFERGTIQINKQLQKEKNKSGHYQLVSIKNDKARTIAVPAYVLEALRRQRIVQSEWQLKAGSDWNNDLNLVFTNEVGGHLSHFTVYKHFKRVLTSLGLPEVRFHDLRHSYAVAALESGIDVKTVQENLGHHTAAFTLDVYGHVSERMKLEGAARMQEYISSVKNL